MKNIRLTITEDYLDNRKNNHFEGSGPLLEEQNVLEVEELSSDIGFDYIDFKNGTIHTKEGVFQSGVPFKVNHYSVIEINGTLVMEDDGVPCNENTLFIHLRCHNSANHEDQEVDMPYKLGATITLKAHPYCVTVIRLDNEEVELEVNDGKKTTKHVVQLYNHAYRDDQWSYATGIPNDPVDTMGPELYMYLKRK